MSNPEFHHLIDSLRSAPRQTIQGVVDPSGVGAGKSPGEALWRMTFSLAAWCTANGPVRRTKLTVRREVDDAELTAFRGRLPEGGVVALEVGLLEETGFGGPQAWLHAIAPERPFRSELVQVAEDLGKPVTTEDPQFGTFTLERRFHWHAARTFWGTDSVRLALNTDSDDDAFPQNTLAQARMLWSHQERWQSEIHDLMVRELLALKNGDWLEENESELDREEFLGRVALQSITVNPDGSFEFWYEDGDLFWGHAIMASGSLAKGLATVGIHG